MGECEVEIGIDGVEDFSRFANSRANVEQAQGRLRSDSKIGSVLEAEL